MSLKSFLFKSSVDVIVSDFQKVVTKLDNLAIIHSIEVDAAKAKIEASKVWAQFHATEQARALSIKSKIEALIK